MGFWNQADALILLEQKRDEWGVSTDVVVMAAGAEEIELASSIIYTDSKPTSGFICFHFNQNLPTSITCFWIRFFMLF